MGSQRDERPAQNGWRSMDSSLSHSAGFGAGIECELCRTSYVVDAQIINTGTIRRFGIQVEKERSHAGGTPGGDNGFADVTAERCPAANVPRPADSQCSSGIRC